ncbi:DUF6221 family protein [Actinomadura nitritigenes]|uniref:DUF6221 family protein n=1 Tax=Actinomadura nitritigenes TaxID=134602 RepID=UPI003D89BC1A
MTARTSTSSRASNERPQWKFLRARLDEDEEVARETRRFEQRVPHTERWFASHGNAITSMAPHRAVAEVEAKQAIVARAETTFELAAGNPASTGSAGSAGAPATLPRPARPAVRRPGPDYRGGVARHSIGRRP